MSIEVTSLTRSRRLVSVDIVVGDGEEKKSEKCVFSFLTITPQKYDEFLKMGTDRVLVVEQLVALDLRCDDIVDAEGKPAALTQEVLASWDVFNLLNLQSAILAEIFPKNVQSSPTIDAGS